MPWLSRFRLLGVSALVLAGILPARAQGSATVFELKWRAPAPCRGADAVRSEVLRLAGSKSAARTLRADVAVVAEANGGFALSLSSELDGVAGQRRLTGASCDAVTDAAVLILALILNPEAEREAAVTSPPDDDAASPVEPAPSPPRPAAPARTASAPAPRAPAPSTPSALRVTPFVTAAAGAQYGLLPSVGPEFELGGGAGLGPAALRLSLGFAPPQHANAPGTRAGGSLWLGSLEALACGSATLAPVSLGLCAGGILNRIQGHGSGVVSPQDGSVLFGSAAFGALIGVRVSRRLVLEIPALMLLSPERPRLYLEEVGVVHQPRRIAGKLRAGLRLEWP